MEGKENLLSTLIKNETLKKIINKIKGSITDAFSWKYHKKNRKEIRNTNWKELWNEITGPREELQEKLK